MVYFFYDLSHEYNIRRRKLNKNKIFGVVTSGVLLFTASSPTVLAVANSQSDELVEYSDIDTHNSIESIILSNEDETSEEIVLEILENADGISFAGTALERFSVQLYDESSESIIDLNTETGAIQLADILNSRLIVSDENEVIYESSITELVESKDQSHSLHSETDYKIEEVQSDVEVNDEIEANSESPTDEKTEIPVTEEPEIDEEPEIAEEIEEVENDTIISQYNVEDYINEEDVALPRASEIDELLHGQEAESAIQPRMSMFSTSSTRSHVNGIYTVRSGDTFNAIATSFSLSTRQLQEWNGHVSNTSNLVVGTRLAVNRRGVESMLSSSDKARLYSGGATPVFSTPQGFIDEIAPRAIAISNQAGQQALYPSLMIAQAAHESNYGRSSLASPPYYNLSGIKGTHNGNSTLMWTWEVLGGVRVDVLAGFRQYPSYDASLQDYANLMRRGLSWDRNYYAGTWRSNTSSVWQVLDNGGLRGYATDPNYFAAIRRIINQFDLTKYDTGNFYVRTGTFLGQTYTTQHMNRLKSANSSFTYRIERDNNMQPYSYRRIESNQEFLGTAGAQRVIDQIQREMGWSASMVQTGNSTQRHRVRSGFFNTLERAERALLEFTSTSGYAATIERGTDGKYRVRTGFFNGYASAQNGQAAMQRLGWAAIIQESSDSTPHYIVRTGTFNTPNHVNRAETYFSQNGWGSSQVLSSSNNYYYRIFIEGFTHESQATSYVTQLRNTYNWGSTAFPVSK